MMSALWSIYLAVTLISHTFCTLSPENEVPLRATTWLIDGKNTPVYLRKGHTHRLHFTLRKKTTALMLAVSPCSGRIEWSLTAHTLKDKPAKDHYWSFKKSEPEVWWRKSASEKTLHTYSGSAVDTYEGPALHPVSVYTLRIHSQEDTHAHVYYHEGPVPWGIFPELPFDPRVHMLGVGMSSVTLTWSPSPSVIKALHTWMYEYCVTVNRRHNYRSLCEAQEEKGGRKGEWNKRGVIQLDRVNEHACVCKEVESVCTVSELLPNTLYYFDVFVIDKINGTSAAYTGTVAHTHAESHTHTELQTPAAPHTHRVTMLREGQVQWVTLWSGKKELRNFRFRPRGEQKNGLLTLQSCNNTNTLLHTLSVSVSARGNELTSQEVGDELVQIWLQGFSSYVIQLRLSTPNTHAVERKTVCVKMQASSAFHRQGAPALPHTLHIKSFNTLRTCSSVTLAWMGTEERGLYCLYRRQVDEQGETSRDRVIMRGPKSETGKDRVIRGGQKIESGGDKMIRSGQESETGRGRVILGGQRNKRRGDRVTRGEQRSEAGGDRAIQDRQRGETGGDRVIWSGQRSKTDGSRARQGGQRSEAGGDRVIPSGQGSETGGSRARQGRQRSEAGRDRVIRSGQGSETGGSRARQSGQRSEAGGDRVIWSGQGSDIDRCLAPESRPPDQRVLCKYFQELDARRAVTTATVGGLQAETLYTFDIYLIRRWALPVKYHSKTVRTRRDC